MPSKFDVEFSYVGFGFYSLITNDEIFNPRAFKMITGYQGCSYNRVFLNFWVLR